MSDPHLHHFGGTEESVMGKIPTSGAGCPAVASGDLLAALWEEYRSANDEADRREHDLKQQDTTWCDAILRRNKAWEKYHTLRKQLEAANNGAET